MSVKVEIVKAPKIPQPPDEIVIRVPKDQYQTLIHLFMCWQTQMTCSSKADVQTLAYDLANALRNVM